MLWYNSKHQTLILGPSNLKIPPICRNLRREWLVKCHLSLILNKPNNPPHLQKSANWRKGRKGLLSAVILLFLNLILLTVLQKCVKHKTHIQMSCLRNTQLKPKSLPNPAGRTCCTTTDFHTGYLGQVRRTSYCQIRHPRFQD